MDTTEFEDIASALDAQIEQAKKDADTRSQREALEKSLKAVSGRISTLEPKIAELVKYGIKPEPKVEKFFLKLLEERKALQDKMDALGQVVTEARAPVAVQPFPDKPLKAYGSEYRLSIEDVREAEDIIRDADAEIVSKIPKEKLAPYISVLALRWRIVADKFPGGDATEGVMRKAYAIIKNRIEENGLPGHSALAKRATGDWARLLADERARLAEDPEADITEEISKLMEAVAEFDESPRKASDVKKLRHAVRIAAKEEGARDEIAGAVSAFREDLGDEFDYLWKGDGEDGDDEAGPQGDMTPRELMSRVFSRMVSKKIIGGCHMPFEKIIRGLPQHQRDIVLDAVEILDGAGVLRVRSTSIGKRVSLEPKWLVRVQAFIDGKPFEVLADWLKENSKAKA